MITVKTKEAYKHFMSVLESAGEDQVAVVRVGITPSDPIRIYCVPHPVQSLPIKLAASANIVVVHLQSGDIKKAEKLAKQIPKSWPGSGIVYQVIGSVYRFIGDHPAAVKSWEKPLNYTDPSEKDMIHEWLIESENS